VMVCLINPNPEKSALRNVPFIRNRFIVHLRH
jgi:hypothetical protein